MTNLPSDQDRIRAYIESSSRSISDIVRLLAVGYLIIFFVSATEENVKNAFSSYKIFIFAIGASGIVALFFDYLNNILRLTSSFDAYRDENYNFNNDSLKYKAANFFFLAKQIVCLIGAAALIWVFIAYNYSQI